MLSGTNSINSNNNNSLISANDTSALLSALGSGASSFDSIFSQAMSQATTPADKAKTAFQQVQFDNLNTLYSAVNGTNSTDSLFGGSNDSLFGSVGSLAMDLGSVPAQVNQLEQQLGLIPASGNQLSGALNTNQALSLEAQMLQNQNLASFGSNNSSSVNAFA